MPIHALRTSIPFAFTLSLSLIAGCSSPPNSVLRLQAKDAIDQNDYVTAREKLDRALARDPADWKANYYMGLVRLHQERPLDARLYLEVAYSLRDDDEETPAILDALAQALHKEGDIDKLDIMLKSATARYGRPHDYFRQAKFLGLQGDVDGSRAAFLKAAKVSRPDDITPYMKQADFYEGLGDRVNAVVALQQAQQIEPHNRVIATRISALVLDPKPAADATVPVVQP